MQVQRWHTSWVVHAPAKLNLFFEVLGRREDGYHLIETLVVPVNLYDTLVLEEIPGSDIVLDVKWVWKGDWAELCGKHSVPVDETNLVYRAARLIQQETAITRGVRIQLWKRIPTGAGLGGGSSDAAAALVALCQLWHVGVSPQTLHDWGARLGSDVPLFLEKGPSVCRGRGEIVEPVRPGPPLHAVVVKPPVSLATREVYGACRVPETPQPVTPLLQAWQRGDWASFGKRVFNRLEEPALRLAPGLAHLKQSLAQTGGLAVSLTGSGSCYFAVYSHREQALAAARRIQSTRLGAAFVVHSVV
ncbi:4-diphosphocytidyl-2-C-methyl-D-erythritol kinase [Thermogutta terrifontis]|jgi:4-diphosphocytidyl-2-C-methyl-D-erythritol kinase|uniref:4-diphosphocytidyl-2-C-methyl-D-erythritol kinase n=1 Tax=Thermogutta terrifontis TaxID=1331910 RepID=A0A286RMA9_9BACT|nr:4-(cytidine 5'-diphospho)-2-C-methyl-D-erythritol kinase [Thermogutta terrifontis]ASV77071.1 4-diphosphocytidyl-2-C-methyl-D-erythritol kinase [Thermogutta terrifontis]